MGLIHNTRAMRMAPEMYNNVFLSMATSLKFGLIVTDRTASKSHNQNRSGLAEGIGPKE